MNYVNLGFLALTNRDYQEAVNIFKRALERRREADAFFGLGVAHYHLGDLPTARWALYQALELPGDRKKVQQHIDLVEGARRSKPPAIRRSRFRAGKDYLEIHHEGAWKKFFVKGVNIGLGLPGYFPGEYAIKSATYSSWFGQIAALGVNAVRVYTVQPPCFYEALARFNESGTPLYLFQGIWAELPEGNDFREPRYLAGVRADFRSAVDALYGNTVLPERPGYAYGPYEYDVSPYLAGIIFGREWESCAVRGYNELNQRETGAYHGKFLSITGGSPFEVWITGICDDLQQYEFERYGVSHPVSTVNWPTLDPLDHPSESSVENEMERQGMQVRHGDCVDAHDAESLDLSAVAVGAGNGFFASYHVYPYYPDFMIYGSPQEQDPYRAYLRALKRRHGDQPVLIAEFGIPTSRETAHRHPAGWDHGRHTDREQGAINGLLMKSIHETGMAGGVLFSWFDEWCKKTWLFGEYMVPSERRPFWFNMQDPEQNYGLLAAYPGYPGKKVTLAGRRDEWKDAPVLYEKAEKTMAFRFHDDSDDARRLTRLSAQHDEGFLYLRLETAGPLDFSRAHYLIGLDTSGSGTGERQLPFGTNLRCPSGLGFLIHLAGKEKSRILAAASYDKYVNAGGGVIMPAESDQGAWVMMQNLTNRRRVSKDGKRFYPAQVAGMSRLRFGSLATHEAAYDSLADFFFRENAVELRIPWGLLNFTDPSSKSVLWKGSGGLVKKTDGVRLIAVSYRPSEQGFRAAATGQGANHADCLPADFRKERVQAYSWDGWDSPVYHTYLKASYHSYRRILADLQVMP